jgi:hypothetical protein
MWYYPSLRQMPQAPALLRPTRARRADLHRLPSLIRQDRRSDRSRLSSRGTRVQCSGEARLPDPADPAPRCRDDCCHRHRRFTFPIPIQRGGGFAARIGPAWLVPTSRWRPGVLERRSLDGRRAAPYWIDCFSLMAPEPTCRYRSGGLPTIRVLNGTSPPPHSDPVRKTSTTLGRLFPWCAGTWAVSPRSSRSRSFPCSITTVYARPGSHDRSRTFKRHRTVRVTSELKII